MTAAVVGGIRGRTLVVVVVAADGEKVTVAVVVDGAMMRAVAGFREDGKEILALSL